MTDDNRRKKAQAVFFSLVMVLSMVGGSVALAGSAAAAPGSISADNAYLSVGDSASFTVNDDDQPSSATVGFYSSTDGIDEGQTEVFNPDSATSFELSTGGAPLADTNGDGTIAGDEVTVSGTGATVESVDPVSGIVTLSASTSSEITIEYDTYPHSTTVDASSGEATASVSTTSDATDLEVVSGDTVTAAYWDASAGVYRTATQAVDDDTPNLELVSDTTVTTSTPSIKVNVTDDTSPIAVDSIEVTVTNTANDKIVTDLVNIGETGNGVTFQNGNVTINAGQGDVPELADGTYDVNVEAEDEAGNSATLDASNDVTVDTSNLVFDLTSPSENLINTVTPTVSVDYDAVGDSNLESVNLTLTNSSGYSQTTSESSVGAGSTSLSLDPGTGIPELNSGEEYTVEVNGTDVNGNDNETSYTFSVDANDPMVETVSVSGAGEDGVFNNEEAEDVDVGVTFNESVTDAVIDIRDSEDTIIDGQDDVGLSIADDGLSGSATVDIADSNTEAEDIRVVVESATDVANNQNTTEVSSDTFTIDTEAPNVNTQNLPGTALSGVVDVRDYFTVANQDGDSITYFVKEESEDPSEYEEIDSPAALNTSTLTEGELMFSAVATDDAGNTGSASFNQDVDNVDPSIDYIGSDAVSGEVDVSTLFEVSNAGTYADTIDYEADSGLTVGGDGTVDVSTLDEGSSVTFTATVDDTEGVDQVTTSETVTVDNVVVDGLSLDTTGADNDEGNLTVTVSSDTDLDELNVTLATDDDHYEQPSGIFSLANDQLTETEVVDGYEYTAEVVPPRDGNYVASVVTDSVEAADGRTASSANVPADSTQEIDNSAPSITDADVINGDQNGLVVNVTFDEPIDNSLDADAYGVAVDGVDATSVTDTGAQGYVQVSYDAEFQTNDAPDVTVGSGVTSAFGDTATESSQGEPISTAELDLKSGSNLVSVPAESGSLNLTQYDLTGVDAIWEYDAGDDPSWQVYTPGDAPDDFTSLEPGQGYVVFANSDTTVDVNVENVPVTTGPAAQEIEHGWNLVGHFQEGDQATKRSLATIDENTFDVLGQVDGSYNLDQVNTFEPGEAYWVFSEGSDVYTRQLYAQGPTINSLTVEDKDQGDQTVTNGDTVSVSADVVDIDGSVSSVELDASSLGAGTVPLNDNDQDNVYTGEFDVSDGAATESSTLTLTATDNNGLQSQDAATLDLDNQIEGLGIDVTSAEDSNNARIVVTSDEELDALTITGTNALSGESPWNLADNESTALVDGTYYYNFSTSTTISGDQDYTAEIQTGDATDMEGASSNSLVGDTLSSVSGSNFGISGTSVTSSTNGDAPYNVDDQNSNQEITFTVDSLSVDQDTDYFQVQLPDKLATDGSLSVNSVTVDGQSPDSSAQLVDGYDDDSNDDTIKFADSVSDPSVEIVVDFGVTYNSPTTGDIPVDARIESGNTVSEEDITTYQVDDGSSPAVTGQSYVNDSAVTVTIEDGGTDTTGVNTDTIEDTDFGLSTDATIESIDVSGSPGIDSSTVTLHLAQPEDTDSLTVNVDGSIEDQVGNELTTASSSPIGMGANTNLDDAQVTTSAANNGGSEFSFTAEETSTVESSTIDYVVVEGTSPSQPTAAQISSGNADGTVVDSGTGISSGNLQTVSGLTNTNSYTVYVLFETSSGDQVVIATNTVQP